MWAFILAVVFAVVTAFLIGIIYPLVRPEQARSANDPVGYWLGSLLIPAACIVGLIWGARIEKRKRARMEREGKDDRG